MGHGEVGIRAGMGSLQEPADLGIGFAVGAAEGHVGEAGTLGLRHLSVMQVPGIQPALQVLPTLAIEVVGVV